MNDLDISVVRQYAPVVRPFTPVDEQEYRVYYEEGPQVRYLIGTLKFPEAGGAIVHRTRAVPATDIYVPYYVKIEEEPAGSGRAPSARF